MLCPACGFENAEAARFCGSCGGRLTGLCPHCGAEVAFGLRFCTTCGVVLPDAARARTSLRARDEDALPAERRLVSVLFADLVNFTPLAESLDAEEVRAIQSRYFETARSVIARYGGTIEKFIGDAVMALWGAPLAHEDDAERAVRAALELVDAVNKMGGAPSDRRLSARAAVMTGEAVVTVGARGQGMVTGDLVNTAGRLQAEAPSGGVLVNEAARRAAEGVTFEPAGAFALKGKSGELPAWRAIGPAADGERGRVRTHAGRFVGRDPLLMELIDLFRNVVRQRRGRLVSLIGTAGVGKSRLIWEFGQYIDSLPDGVAWHLGRAPAYGEGITFAALAEMVRRRARISEGMDAEVARRQLATAIRELVRSETERQWIEPRIAVLIDPNEETAYERDELFAAWRRFFERVSEFAPAVLVFEDLHWADASLIDFIEHLAVWTRGHRILIVTASRPEFLDRRPSWSSGLHTSTVLHLDGLPDRAMHDLLLGLAPGIPADVSRHILNRAGGVPLYAVEVVRMLVDQDRLVDQDGGLGPVAPIDRIDVPDTLRGLIAARIDLLPAAERSLLLAGAILGSRFHADALAAMTDEGPTSFGTHVEALVRRELLTVDDELPSPGRGQLAFVQDIVREVAAGILSRRDRHVLHLAAADYLDALRDDELVEAIAGHLLDAHKAVPDHSDARDVADRARAALGRAAQRAMALHAPARALDYLHDSLALVSDAEERAAIWESVAAAARAAARFDVAEQYLGELVAFRTLEGRRPEAARASAQLASLLLMVQRNEAALGRLEDAVQAVGDLESDPASIELAGQLARAKMIVGEDAAALDWANRAISAAERLDLHTIATDTLITRGTARVHLGDATGGLDDLRRAIDTAAGHELVGTELRARNNLAWLMVTDDPRVTMETARGGMELATAMGIGDMALQLADVATAAAVDTGDWEWALDTLVELNQHPTLAPSHRIGFAVNEAVLRALRGEPSSSVLQALEPIDPATDRQILAAIDYARAWIAFIERRYGSARDSAERAAAGALAAERFQARALATRACVWLGDRQGVSRGMAAVEALRMSGRAVGATHQTLAGGAAALVGRRLEAAAMYDDAVRRWRDLNLPLHLSICLLERHRLLGDESAQREAVGLLEGLGAEGLLQSLRQPA